jgi:precorrin-4/cobalt-precorrin-4 C11-methyltransferase
MTVHFIGAGPGAADLLTLRGRDILARCQICLYAGSIVPRAMLDHCPAGARLIDTAPLSLDAIEAEYRAGSTGSASPGPSRPACPPSPPPLPCSGGN